MKKKGAALVTVLVIFTSLIIVGTSISVAVINSVKLNKRYSDTIDLELAAKSGVNIIKEDFISRVNSENENIKIETLSDVEEYKDKVNSSSWSNSDSVKIFLDEYAKGNIKLVLELNLNDENKLTITSTAKSEGKVSVEKVEEDSLVLNIRNESTGTGGNGSGDISILGDTPVAGIFNSDNSILRINSNANLNYSGGVFVKESSKGHSQNCSHNPKTNYNILYKRINNTDFLCEHAGNPSEGDIKIMVPNLNISNETNTNPIISIYNGSNDGTWVNVYTNNNGNYEYIKAKIVNGQTYDIIISNDDIVIENLSNQGMNENLSNNTLIIVTSKDVIFKAKNQNGNSMSISNLAIMAKNIISEMTGAFNPGSLGILLIPTEKLVFSNNSININSPFETNKYKTIISIINDIIQNKEITE